MLWVRSGRYRVCELFGIPIYLDVTFAVLLLMMMWGRPLAFGLGSALLLAVSVVLHELGHSLTARAFGYQTTDITISLIGGCASLIALPRKAWQELVTAAAGPAVSFLLSGMSLLTWMLAGPENIWLEHMLAYGFFMNLMLGLFNLLPGFPMDGGRIFRSVLRSFLSRARATYVAMVVGRVTAVLIVAGPLLFEILSQIMPGLAESAGESLVLGMLLGGSVFFRLLIAWMIWTEGYREYVQARMESGWEYQDFRARVSPPPYGGDGDDCDVRRGR